MTTRTWISTLLLAALAPAPACAQGMIEAGAITSQSTTVARPDWAKGEDEAPATRFVKGAGIADGSWFRAMGIEQGAFSSIGTGSASQPQRAVPCASTPSTRVAARCSGTSCRWPSAIVRSHPGRSS